MVHVGELADDADGTAHDRGRIGGEARLEGANVGIERTVGDANRQFGVHPGRQGDAAGRRHRQARRRHLHLQRHQVAGDANLAEQLPDAFVAREEIADRAAHVVARQVEGTAAARGEVDQPREGHRRALGQAHALDGNGAAAERERIGAVPADVGGAIAAPLALGELDAVETDAVALQPHRRRGLFERLAVGHPVRNRHRAEAERAQVFAVGMELAGQHAVHSVVEDAEGSSQILHRPVGETDPRVELLAAVAPGETGGKTPVGANLPRARADDHALGVDVAVLDHRRPVHRAPVHTPGAHVLAGDRAFDARAPEGVEHRAVERAVSANLDGVGRGAEGGEDAGHQAIALLPVGAGDVERDARVGAVRGAALELDQRGRCGQPAAADVNPVRLDLVGQAASDRHGLERPVVAERSERFAGRGLFGNPRHRDLARLQLGAAGRYHVELAFSAAVLESAARPLQAIAARHRAGEPQPLQLQVVADGRQIHVFIGGVEGIRGGDAGLPQRRHPVAEVEAAAVEPARGVGHLHRLRHPLHVAAQVAEAQRVEPGVGAGKGALQLAAGANAAIGHRLAKEMERAGERALAGERDRVLGEEDLPHPRKVDRRLHAVHLLGEVGQVRIAHQAGLGSPGVEIDVREHEAALADGEGRVHVEIERLVLLNLHRAAVEPRQAAVLVVGAGDGDVEVARHHAPGRAVVLEGGLAVACAHVAQRRGPGAAPLPRAAAAEAGKAGLAVGQLLHEHLPLVHVDGAEDDAAREERAPRHADAQPLDGEKRRRLRCQSFDDQVVELELTAPQPDAEPADAHRPLDEARPLALRLRLE